MISINNVMKTQKENLNLFRTSTVMHYYAV